MAVCTNSAYATRRVVAPDRRNKDWLLEGYCPFPEYLLHWEGSVEKDVELVGSPFGSDVELVGSPFGSDVQAKQGEIRRSIEDISILIIRSTVSRVPFEGFT